MGRRSSLGHGPGQYRRPRDPRGQIAAMARDFPGLEAGVGRDRRVTWTGDLQPSPHSDSYRIRVVYERRGPPSVFVDCPRLDPDAPHRWPDGSLCLHWPKEWRWKDVESLAGTVVMWAALWLQYYEVWKQVGAWLGPSSHQEFPSKDGDEDDA